MDKKTATATGVSAIALALAAALIAGFEGKRNLPYRDPVGILTVCYGHTGKDIENRRYSDAECMALLQKDVQKHAAALQCVKAPLDLKQQIAFVSFAYNIGQTNFCSSTTLKRANAGNMAGACEAMGRWIKGRKNGVLVTLPGLVNRRGVERAICEGDFETAAAIIKRVGLQGLVEVVDEIAEEQDAEPPAALSVGPAAVSKATVARPASVTRIHGERLSVFSTPHTSARRKAGMTATEKTKKTRWQ